MPSLTRLAALALLATSFAACAPADEQASDDAAGGGSPAAE